MRTGGAIFGHSGEKIGVPKEEKVDKIGSIAQTKIPGQGRKSVSGERKSLHQGLYLLAVELQEEIHRGNGAGHFGDGECPPDPHQDPRSASQR